MSYKPSNAGGQSWILGPRNGFSANDPKRTYFLVCNFDQRNADFTIIFSLIELFTELQRSKLSACRSANLAEKTYQRAHS